MPPDVSGRAAPPAAMPHAAADIDTLSFRHSIFIDADYSDTPLSDASRFRYADTLTPLMPPFQRLIAASCRAAIFATLAGFLSSALPMMPYADC
jgi:hypothetical protein